MDFESYRDRKWRREEALRVETAAAVEAMVEDLGFCLGLTDARTNLPSVYIAVCGRRDAFMPRNVQKDPEASLAWVLKDEVMMRGRVYYAKLVKGRSMFVAPRLIPAFNAIWGMPRREERDRLSANALRVLKVLRKEWEMGSSDLRAASGIADRKDLTKAVDELQKHLKVIPQEVVYEPKFTYIWTIPEARFPKELAVRKDRETAVREIALAYLEMCGTTGLGELSRATGLPRWETGRANHQLVEAGLAVRLARGVYRTKKEPGSQPGTQ